MINLLSLDEIMGESYIFFVDRNSPAFEAVKRIIRAPYRPGEIIPVSKEELKSLRKDLLAVRIKED